MKIAVTGISGFIGTHLKNYLSTKEDVEVRGIHRNEFSNSELLKSIVAESDVIIHLAAVNRHDDQDQLYDINISLVKSLVEASSQTNNTPYIIFSSSSQENSENQYGRSKLEGQKLLEKWTKANRGKYTGLVIPNVFGPFGKPFYNSVVATFCHQIARGEQPIIKEDKVIQLIYVNELVENIWNLINYPQYGRVRLKQQFEIRVSELLNILNNFGNKYLTQNELPLMHYPFELALFCTFRCYIPEGVYPIKLNKNVDNRGVFVEIMRNNSGGQFSFSTTKPGITRGNHFHTRKFERFAVIKGQAVIKMRRIDCLDVIEYNLDGENPSFVDMPVWHTHNITNVGNQELITLFWINEPFDPADSDTFYLNV